MFSLKYYENKSTRDLCDVTNVVISSGFEVKFIVIVYIEDLT